MIWKSGMNNHRNWKLCQADEHTNNEVMLCTDSYQFMHQLTDGAPLKYKSKDSLHSVGVLFLSYACIHRKSTPLIMP